MDLLLIILSVFLAFTLTLQWRAYSKLKKQNQLITLQSREIQKQMGELKEKRQQLEDLFHEKQQMLSVVSHDLKGPFNRVFALVQLMNMAQHNLTEEQKEYLSKIHQIVADGLSMVRNLLDNRRLEEKGIDLMPEKLNISTIVSSLVKNSVALAQKKDIALHFSAPPQAFVYTDKLYLNRVFENLISNAMKFSPIGKTISVAVAVFDEEVTVSVKDEGPGIAPEEQNRLYQKFQRLSARPTAGESSTGLGLSIAKSFLDKIGGTIRCVSEIGKGAEFIVSLKRLVE